MWEILRIILEALVLTNLMTKTAFVFIFNNKNSTITGDYISLALASMLAVLIL